MRNSNTQNHAFTMAGAGQREVSRKSLVSSREFTGGQAGLLKGFGAYGYDSFARSAFNEPLTPHTSPLTRAAFTMAEILLSLTIIGVVAAITLPSLTGNINERTWNTQRKAFFARMSQAIALMPAINGYGTFNATVDNAAETFITSGLSKVLKINNICDNDHLSDCGWVSQFNTIADGKVNLPKKMASINAGFAGNNTNAAAFETANGESVLVHYNPKCTASNVFTTGYSDAGDLGYHIKQHVCTNFLFDLNGTKGPNTVGKDIGFITVLYSSDPKVVMPILPKALQGEKNWQDATKGCANLDEDYRLPNLEETISLYANRQILGNSTFPISSIWTGTVVDSDSAWAIGHGYGMKYARTKDSELSVICVKR